jgi:hypothetical protein
LQKDSIEDNIIVMKKNNKENDEFIKQLEETAKQLPETFPDIVSTLFGRLTSNQEKDDIGKSISTFQEMINKIAPGFTSLNKIQDKKARNKEFDSLVDIAFKPFLVNVPPDQGIIDYYVDFFDTTKPVPTSSFLLDSPYDNDVAVVSELSKDFISSVPMKKRSDFLDSVFISDQDILSIGQLIVTEFPTIHKEFSQKRKRYTKRQATKDIEYYGKLAGHYEKCISVVVGIIRLINGENVTYEQMRRRQLSKNLRSVNSSKYSFLTTGFNQCVRNAIAHKQFTFYPQKRTVQFYDPITHFTVDYTYKEIHEKTINLYALFISIQRLPMQIWSDTLSKFKSSM